MPRIRSIKPEFWSSPNLPPDPWPRLLFMAMWNWADDNGVGTANPRELLGFAFPNDDHITVADLRRMLVEIRRVFDVKFYTVAGRPYYAIPSWESHQKFDRRSRGKHPAPEEAETWLYQDECDDSEEARVIPTSPRRDSVAGTGEQGNRGTGEEDTSSTAPRSKPADPDGFDEFWESYPRRQGKGEARKAYAKALKAVDARTLIDGATRYAQDPNRSEQFTAMAATWLNQERWADDPLPSRNPLQAVPNRADAKVQGYLDTGRRLIHERKELA